MISYIFYDNIGYIIYGNTIIVEFVMYNMILFRKKHRQYGLSTENTTLCDLHRSHDTESASLIHSAF